MPKPPISPLISIVMPVKNATPYLNQCLDSILNQTYQNWELIAINDHSSDQSPNILKQYAQQDQRIQTFDNQPIEGTNTTKSTKGTGIIDALRLAYSKSKGQFITRMDADDKMTPHKLETMQRQLTENGEGHLAVGKVKYFSETTLGEGYQQYEKWLNEMSEKGNNFIELYKECVIPSPCWMVHKEDFDKCEAFNFDRYPEDYDLCFRFYEAGLKVIPTQEVLHHWRDYHNRTSRTSEHYANNHFTAIKCHYFLKLNHDKQRPIILWGAGNRGKAIAQNFIKAKQDFYWACNNPNKVGHDIYGKVIRHTDTFEDIGKNMVKGIGKDGANLSEIPQTIIAVANKEEQQRIAAFLQNKNFKPMKDYFFFC